MEFLRILKFHQHFTWSIYIMYSVTWILFMWQKSQKSFLFLRVLLWQILFSISPTPFGLLLRWSSSVEQHSVTNAQVGRIVGRNRPHRPPPDSTCLHAHPRNCYAMSSCDSSDLYLEQCNDIHHTWMFHWFGLHLPTLPHPQSLCNVFVWFFRFSPQLHTMQCMSQSNSNDSEKKIITLKCFIRTLSTCQTAIPATTMKCISKIE